MPDGEKGRQAAEAAWRETKKLGKKGADAAKGAYDITRKTITQEEAFAEFGAYFAEVTQVLTAQHARIAALEARLTALEAGPGRARRPSTRKAAPAVSPRKTGTKGRAARPRKSAS